MARRNKHFVGLIGAVFPLAVDTFAALDPASRAGQPMTLTDNNLTATSGSNTGVNGYVDANMTAGATDKIYFECRVANIVNQWCSFGFGNTDIAYYSQETRLWKNGAIYQSYSSPQLSAGDVIGCAADFQNGTVAFYNNNGNLIGSQMTDVAFSTRTPDFQLISSHSITLNFGKDASFANQENPSTTYTDANGFGEFYHEPPAGFVGLYTTTEGNVGMLTLYDRYVDRLSANT